MAYDITNIKDADGLTYEDRCKQYGIVPEKGKNYCDNKKLYEQLVPFHKEWYENHEKGLPPPKIPDYVAESIFLIANHLSYRPNFLGYTYREDMICDAIENCLSYIHYFNPEKSQNPFAYITQICWYAFLRRIKLEKRQQVLKGMVIMNSEYDDHMQLDQGEESKLYHDYLNNISIYTEIAEEEIKKKEEKKKYVPVKKQDESENSPLSDFFA